MDAKAQRTETAPRQRRRNIMMFLAIAIANIVVLVIIYPIRHSKSFSIIQFKEIESPDGLVHLQIYDDDNFGPYTVCPTSPEMALQANCSFDLLANGWIPPLCFDAEMHHDFVDGRDYGFYEDELGAVKVHQKTIMEGDISKYPEGLWVTFDEHFQHCRYLLNGSTRAISPPITGLLDTFLDDEHMQHCIGLLSERREASHIETTVKTWFTAHRCYLSPTSTVKRSY